MTGCLYVAATPIGNLGDVSRRLAQVLSEADLVLAEDTRVSSRLLDHLGIERPMRSLHEHNETQAAAGLVSDLAEGRSMVLISDAGTPLISDPGYRLIAAARDAGCEVIPVPGPSAITAALSVAGLATDRFTFHGFLSARGGERRRQLAQLAERSETQVLFEACHRISALVSDAIEVLGGDRVGFVAREISKRHEQYVRASLADLKRRLDDGSVPARGEFVLLLAGAPESDQPQGGPGAATVIATLAADLPHSQAARLAARLTGLSRRECFERIQRLKNAGQ